MFIYYLKGKPIWQTIESWSSRPYL